jgi:hypothetical protein
MKGTNAMSDTPQYKTGDVANGHVLTEQPDGTQTWVPVAAAPAVKKPGPVDRFKALSRPKQLILGGGALALLLAIIIANGANAERNSGTGETTAATKPSAAATKEAEPTKAPPVMVVVPATAGMTSADAAAALTAAGFAVSAPDLSNSLDVVIDSVPAAGQELTKGAKLTLTMTEKPKLSIGQQQALKSAESYLRMGGFSRAGLLKQLTSEYGESFPIEDATYAVDNSGADWNAQAAKSAQSYIDMGGFSRDGLFEQLTSEYGEQFTADEANAGLAAVGY